jgi:hypothetical protein
MRIYEGSPRQDWEEVLRSVGTYLDDRGMRGLVFVETDTGFIIQGTSVTGTIGSGESMGRAQRETMTLLDDDIGKFMDDALAKRGQAPDATPKNYEAQLRVIGKYIDGQHPRDIFFFEMDGSYVIRLSVAGQGGLKQELVEFTRDDIADLIASAPALRRGSKAKGSPA